MAQNSAYIVGFLNLTTLLLHQNRVSDSPIKYPQLFDDHEILKLLHGTTMHTLLSPYIVFSFRSLFLVVIPPPPASFEARALSPLVSLPRRPLGSPRPLSVRSLSCNFIDL